MQKICLIIPCYNEATRFNQDHLIEYLTKHHAFDFCLVNDGSTDNTEAILNQLAETYKTRIHFLNVKHNVGKAEAIRQAFNFWLPKDQYDYIGYIDADFSAPLNEVDHILAFCNGALTHNIIAGSRIKRLGSTIVRNPARHYLGRIFATFAGMLLKLPIYDSQCGLKLIKSDVAKNLFNEPFISRWLFDLELWFRLRNLIGPELTDRTTLEVPLNEWQDKGGSKLKITNFLKVPVLLFRIHMKYNTAAAKKRHYKKSAGVKTLNSF